MNSLTDRYVHATLGSVPVAERADLGDELRSTIADMVDARLEAGDSPVAAERAALTALGDPGLLAARYTGARLQLLGPRYFLTWKRLTLNLLTWIPGLVASLVAVFMVLDGEGTVGDVAVEALFAAVRTAVLVVFCTTLVFAILDRAATDTSPWVPDLLPLAGRTPSFNDMASGVVRHSLWAALLVFLSTGSGTAGADSHDAAVLDPGLWSFWLPWLLVVLAGAIALEVWRYRRGWGPGVVVATVVVAVAFTAPLAWLAIQGELLNPALTQIDGLGADELDLVNNAIAIGVILSSLWKIGLALLKGVSKRRTDGNRHPT